LFTCLVFLPLHSYPAFTRSSRKMHAILLALALSAGFVKAALTPEQIASVFPDATKLNGGTTPMGPPGGTNAFDAEFVTDGKQLLSVLEVTDGKAIGWLGLGVGQMMTSSDAVIAWPVDGKWTLSHVQPSAYIEPEDLGASEGITLVEDLCSETTVAFLRPITPTYPVLDGIKADLEVAAGQMMVYARSSINPGEASVDAPKGYHDAGFGPVAVDLSGEVATPAAKPVDAAPSDEPVVEKPVEEKPVEEKPVVQPATGADVGSGSESEEKPVVSKSDEAAAKPTAVEKGKPKEGGKKKKCEMDMDDDEEEGPKPEKVEKSEMIKEPKPTKPAVPAESSVEEEAKPSSYAIVTDVSSATSVKGSALLGLFCVGGAYLLL